MAEGWRGLLQCVGGKKIRNRKEDDSGTEMKRWDKKEEVDFCPLYLVRRMCIILNSFGRTG